MRRSGNNVGDEMKETLLKLEAVAEMIFWIRGEKVILDRGLAKLYGVETRTLKQAVRRNRERFPEDFMFVLTREELADWRSQIVMSKEDEKGLRHLPMAFTEQGIAMLSSVLRSRRAIEVNIAIMRTFVQLRTLMDSNRELARKIESLESKYDEKFNVVFDAIRQLIAGTPESNPPQRRAGFHP
jgi:hypothetical protein